jgi:hypothetical protein
MFLFISFCRSFDYQKREEAPRSSISYFRSFEKSRKGSEIESIFGFDVDAKVDGIRGAVEKYVRPCKKVNFTALILGIYDNIAQEIGTSVEGGEEITTLFDDDSPIETTLHHVFSFFIYIIPFIVIGVIAIVLIIARFVVQRYIPARFFEESICKKISYIVFILAFLATVISAILMIAGSSYSVSAFNTIKTLPDTLVDIQKDFMQYYSATMNKIVSITDLWKDEGSSAIKVVSNNLTDLGNNVMNSLNNIMGNLMESGSLIEIYNEGVGPNIGALIQKLQEYPELSDKAQLFENMGFIDKVSNIAAKVQSAIDVVSELLYYSDVMGGFVDEGAEEEGETEYSMRRVLRRILADKNYSFKPVRISFGKFDSLFTIFDIAIAIVIILIILILIISVMYLITVLPLCDNFSGFVVRWSFIFPSITIILLAIAGGAITVLGGFFAYYADKGFEKTIDDTINTVIDVLPARTLDIPDIDLNVFTKGTFDSTIDLPTIVFEIFNFFQKLITENGEAGLYKALDLYKFINLPDIIESLGTSINEIGETLVVPQKVTDFINDLFDNINILIPNTFDLLFNYITEEGDLKTDVVREAVSTSSLPSEDQNGLYEILDYIDENTQLLETVYNSILSEVTNNLKNIVDAVPNTLFGIASYGLTQLGSIVVKTSERVDEALNQVPIKVVQGTYNVLYNALFSDFIEGTSLISAGTLISIICITVMLICFIFMNKKYGNKFEESDTVGQFMI